MDTVMCISMMMPVILRLKNGMLSLPVPSEVCNTHITIHTMIPLGEIF